MSENEGLLPRHMISKWLSFFVVLAPKGRGGGGVVVVYVLLLGEDIGVIHQLVSVLPRSKLIR